MERNKAWFLEQKTRVQTAEETRTRSSCFPDSLRRDSFQTCVHWPVKTSGSTEKNGSFSLQLFPKEPKDCLLCTEVPPLQPVTLRCKLGHPGVVILGGSFILNPTLAVGSDFYVMILCSAYEEVLLIGCYELPQTSLSRINLCFAAEMKHTGATLRTECPWLGVVVRGELLTWTLEWEPPHCIAGALYGRQEPSGHGA